MLFCSRGWLRGASFDLASAAFEPKRRISPYILGTGLCAFCFVCREPNQKKARIGKMLVKKLFCGLFVAFAVFVGGIRQKQGSFAQIFYVWLFITAFVLCGFEHIVADMFYISCYALYYGVQAADVIKILVFVSAGNTAGGLFIAWAVKKLEKSITVSLYERTAFIVQFAVR